MLLDFKETEKLLKQYKIPLIETKLVSNRKEAISFAKKHKYPVVLKAFSPRIIHRTEKGLVKICNNQKELLGGFSKLKRYSLLIQKKGKGIELVCGMKRDPVFDSVLMFGLGGIYVEALKDVSFGFCPLNKKQAMEMIKNVRSYKILKGYRGQSVNLNKLADLLIKLSKLSQDYFEIKEIDFNPVFADSNKIVVADPKIIYETLF